MLFAMIAAAAAMNMDGTICTPQPNYSAASVHISSATNPAYSFPGASNMPVINGRVFKAGAIIGGHDLGPKTDAAHAAAAYGALGDEGVRVSAEVEGLFRFHPTSTVEFSPWTAIPEQQKSPATDAYSRGQVKMAKRAEEARQQWLKDNNYVGGVRTFVNDVTLYNIPAAKPSTKIEPRGVIELAPDSPEKPAFKSRMHVEGKPMIIHLPTVIAKVDQPKAQPAAKVETAKVDTTPAAKPVEKTEEGKKVAQK